MSEEAPVGHSTFEEVPEHEIESNWEQVRITAVRQLRRGGVKDAIVRTPCLCDVGVSASPVRLVEPLLTPSP